MLLTLHFVADTTLSVTVFGQSTNYDIFQPVELKMPFLLLILISSYLYSHSSQLIFLSVGLNVIAISK